MTDHPTATGISSVCIHIGDEHHVRAIASESSYAEGSVFVGLPHLDGVVQFAGSPAQLRSLAAALLEGADDIEQVLASRVDEAVAS